MNPLISQLKQLVKLMSALKKEYAVLGGVAVSVYGEPRMTFDVDVNIMIDISEIEIFLTKAKKFAFSPMASKKFIRATGVIPMKFKKGGTFSRTDFIIAQNPLESAGIKRAVTKKIDGLKLKLVTPEDLIIHKITSQRPRDIEDVYGILARQKGKLDVGYINFWLKKIAAANRKSGLLKEFKDAMRDI